MNFRYLLSISLLFFLFSCGNQKKENIEILLQTWSGKEILFPANSIFTVKGKDTVDFSISGKCYNKQSLYSVYQYNNIFHILSKEQYRNKINNLSDSALFTFHLVSSFALGRIKSYFLQLSISYQSRIVTAKREKDGLVVFASYLH